MSEISAGTHDPEQLVLRYLEDPKPDLKDMIMVQYGSMVERIARRFSGLDAQEDLVQVGFIGLLNALSKFDPKAGVKFNTYATYLVAGEIKHYLRDRTQTIRQPAWLQELRHKVSRAVGTLQAQLGRVPTEDEIAEEIQVSAQAVREVFQTQDMLRVASLDAAMPGDDDGADVDNLDAGAYSPEQLSVEDRVVLEHALRQLRDVEREVLIHFHFDMMNQTEIAHKLGISCNYVSHILRQSLSKLRRILANEDESDRALSREDAEEIVCPITNIFTETYFRSRLTEEIHRSGGTNEAVSVVILQFRGIDTLKSFYGEASVRDFIYDAAEFLRDSVRKVDIVSRFGEDGFALILPSTGASVETVIGRLMKRFAPWLSGRRSPSGQLLVELGQAIFPEDGRNVAELIEAAAFSVRPSADLGLEVAFSAVIDETREAA